MHRLSEDLLAYFRVTLTQKFEAEKRAHILVSTPVDVEFEMLVLACSINLLNDFFSKRFKTSLEEDEKALADTSIPYNIRLCLTNRVDLKRIVHSNIKLCNILIHLLGRIQAEIVRVAEQTPDETEGKFTKSFMKKLYMG
jgi:hypothetical protein